jgi:hypothetical protein
MKTYGNVTEAERDWEFGKKKKQTPPVGIDDIAEFRSERFIFPDSACAPRME